MSNERGIVQTEACILNWLIMKPAHGYELQQALRRYSDVHPMNRVNVYPLLRNLQEKGFVVSRTEFVDSRVRKVYAITDEGRQEFRRWHTSPLEGLHPKVSDPVLMRILISTGDEPFEWLADAIADAERRLHQAQTRFSHKRCDTPAHVRIAVEEQIANLDRRLDFLMRIRTCLEGGHSARPSKLVL
jgi:Predicted transcriptional regulators